MKHVRVVLLLLLAALAHTGMAINCYECNSDQVEQCHSPFTEEDRKYVTKVNCEVQQGAGASASAGTGGHQGGNTLPLYPPACFIAVTQVNGKKTLERGCALQGKKQECESIKTNVQANGGQLESCTGCDSNLCNASQPTAHAPALVVLLLLASLLPLLRNIC